MKHKVAMIQDEEFINILTGEVLPATKAIRQYYEEERHGCLDDWKEEWKPTGNLCEDYYIDAPDFSRVFN